MSPAATWLVIVSLASVITIGGMWLTIDSLKKQLQEYQSPW